MTSAKTDDVMAGGLQFVLAVVACFQKGQLKRISKAELLAESCS
jgi:hypothetical protein